MHQTFNRIFIILFWSFCLFNAALIMYGVNKGMDFTDEGFTLLSFLPDQEQGLNLLPVYSVISRLFSSLSPDIIFYRILRFILLISGTLVFTLGFSAWLNRNLSGFPAITLPMLFPINAILILGSYSVFYSSLSYNSLTLFIILCLSGLFFKLISGSDGNRKQTSFLLIASGFLSYILLLIKFPTALLWTFFLLLIAGYCFTTKKLQLKSLLLYMLLFITGVTLAAGLIGVCTISPVTLVRNYISSAALLPDHDLARLATIYLDDLNKNFIKPVISQKILLAGTILLWIFFRFQKLFLFKIVFLAEILWLAVSTVKNDYFKAGASHLYTASSIYIQAVTLILLLVVFVLADRKSRINIFSCTADLERYSAGCVLLLVIPFMCSAGTNNPLSIHITQFLFSWSVLIFISARMLFSKLNLKSLIPLLFMLMICVNLTFQLWHGYIHSPFRIDLPLTRQQYQATHIQRSASLKFDYETSCFLDSLGQLLKHNNRFQQGQSILSLNSLPGLVYLMGGISPAAPWFFDSGYPNHDEVNCNLLSRSQYPVFKNTIILKRTNEPVSPHFIECLNQKGISYPAGYTMNDSLKLPHRNEWMLICFPVNRQVNPDRSTDYID